METKLAEAIVEACVQNGVKTELKDNFSASWMRGRNTTGIVILDGDLAQFVTAIIANAHLFVDGQLPRFSIKERLTLSPFKLSLILY